MIVQQRSPWSPELIIDHWFREGPVQPDGSDGYWICDMCGGHRGNHVQAEGQWLLPLHTFVPMRRFPDRCKPCGRQGRHTIHIPLFWAQLNRTDRPSDRSEPSDLAERG